MKVDPTGMAKGIRSNGTSDSEYCIPRAFRPSQCEYPFRIFGVDKKSRTAAGSPLNGSIRRSRDRGQLSWPGRTGPRRSVAAAGWLDAYSGLVYISSEIFDNCDTRERRSASGLFGVGRPGRKGRTEGRGIRHRAVHSERSRVGGLPSLKRERGS